MIWNPIIVYYIESNLAKYLRPEFEKSESIFLCLRYFSPFSQKVYYLPKTSGKVSIFSRRPIG